MINMHEELFSVPGHQDSAQYMTGLHEVFHAKNENMPQKI